MGPINENEAEFSRAVELAGIIHRGREKEPLTDSEKQLLIDWLNERETHRALLESIVDRELVAAEVEALLRYDTGKAVSGIFAALGEPLPAVVPLWRKVVRRSLAAAAILLVLTGGVWYFVRQGLQERAAIVANANNLPGTDRAVLTLADGRQVALDSTHVGSLGIQGGAEVRQGKDRLIYMAASGAGSAGASTGALAYNTVTVPRGAQYHLVLADSSEVWLNAASSITYPAAFTPENREVTITGEAYFSVAKDATRPFLVTAGTMKVQVLGTEFDVMAYSDEPAIRATLIKGAIKTSVAGHKGQQQQLLLRPGEQAALGDSSQVLRLEKPNLDEVMGWRFNEFRFHDTELAAIMRQIERWYNVKVEFEGRTAHIGFDGELSRKHRVEDVLDILSDTRKVHFLMKTPNTIVVLPGAK